MNSTEKTIQELQHRLRELEAQIGGGTVAMDMQLIEEELKMLDDPFESQDPLGIFGEIPGDENSPDGYVLRWLSPALRETRGMRGWEWMRWGDEYTGADTKKLQSYGIPDPPAYMQAAQNDDDNLVRRRDVALARLPKKLWQTRQDRRVLESARQLSNLDESTRDRIRARHRGVVPVGDGLKKDKTRRSHAADAKGSTSPEPEKGASTHRFEIPVIPDSATKE